MKNTIALNNLKNQNSLFVVASKGLVKIFGVKDGGVEKSEVFRASAGDHKSAEPKFLGQVVRKLQNLRPQQQLVYLFAPEEILSDLKLSMPKKVVEKIDSEFSGNYISHPLKFLLRKVALKKGAEAKAEAQMRVEKRTAAFLNNIGNSVFPWERQMF